MKSKWKPAAALVLNTRAGEDNMSLAARVLKNERANQSRLKAGRRMNSQQQKNRSKTRTTSSDLPKIEIDNRTTHKM
jgi:hypothetical protein